MAPNRIMGRLLGVLIALASYAAPCYASELRQVLEQAELLRRADPQRVDALLVRARMLAPVGSGRERDHLQLLLAFREVVDGNYEDGFRRLKPIADRSADVTLRYRAALLIANSAALTRDYDRGLRYHSKALELEPLITDPRYVHLARIVGATLYTQLGHPERALEQLSGLRLANVDRQDHCGLLENRARALVETGRALDEARDLVAAADYCERIHDPLGANLIRSSRARYLVRVGRTEEALALLERSMPSARATGYSRLLGEMLAQIAELRERSGDDAAAASAARDVLTLPGLDPRWPATATAHRVLSDAAMRRGDQAAALRHYRDFAASERAFLDEAKAREFAYQMASAEAVGRDRAAAILRQQNAMLRLQERAWKQQAWTMRLSIILLALIILAAGYWGWQARRSHRRLRRLSESDSLTGLCNRRHFRIRAQAALERCQRQGEPVSVLLIDLDEFKQINDRCSHTVGDWVLKQVGDVLTALAVEPIVAGRLGGEEFGVLLPSTGAAEGLAFARRVQDALAGIDAMGGGCYLPISASIGVTCTVRSGYAYEVLMADADTAMYAAKAAGRDRAVVAPLPEAHLRACA